jgi:hypothetical protein
MAIERKSKPLDECREQVSGLKQELVDCKEVIEGDRSAINAGLRLAFKNEELQREISALKKESEKIVDFEAGAAKETSVRPETECASSSKQV